jgi:hypothetical protein
MPCLWGQHNNSQVFLTVGIIDATATNLTGAGRFGASGPLPNMFQALIDTGAQSTMISTNVVRALNLMPIGKRPIQGVGHNVTYHNEYLFRVAFLFPVLMPGQIGVPGTHATAAKPYPCASGSPKCCSGEGGSLIEHIRNTPP